MPQEMGIKDVYNLNDLKRFRRSGATVAQVFRALVMIPKNNKRREATEELFSLSLGLSFGPQKISINKVINLVQQGADVNVTGMKHMTPLFGMCRFNRADMVEYLVEQGADVNVKDDDGGTPLHMACAGGNADVVKYLVKHGADVNAKDDDGETPLHVACISGYADVVKYLVKHGADVNTKDDNGETPLHVACVCGHADVLKYLVKHGANVNAKNDNGETPLLSAERINDKESSPRLLETIKYLSGVGNSRQQPQHYSIKEDNVNNAVNISVRNNLFGRK